MDPISTEPKQPRTNCKTPTSKSSQPELELDDPKKNAQMTRLLSAKSSCLCSPTTHVGSFRCRHHRSTAISRGGSEGSNLSDLAQKSAAMAGLQFSEVLRTQFMALESSLTMVFTMTNSMDQSTKRNLMDRDCQNLRFEGGRVVSRAPSHSEEDGSSSSSSSSSSSFFMWNEPAFSHSCNIRRKGFNFLRSQTTNSSIVCYSSSTRNAADSLEKPKCGRCNEVFSSMKALYGHMRYHLEAPWKASSSLLNDACWSWTVTGRRGRIRKKVETHEVSLVSTFAQTGNSITSSSRE